MNTATGSGAGTGAAQAPFETTVGGGHGSLVELTTGELLLMDTRLRLSRSVDGGRTWSDFAPAVDEQGAALLGGPNSTGLLRLQSGALAITYGRTKTMAGPHDDFGLFIRLSRDEGQTWLPEVRINLPGVYAPSYHNAMIQLSSGRLVFPVRWILAGSHADRGARTHAWGRLGGQRFPVEGHAHRPEMDITFVYYSDDEGQTWQRSRDELMGWFNDGYDGVTPVDEPVAAELRDGRVLLFGRSTVGPHRPVHQPRRRRKLEHRRADGSAKLLFAVSPRPRARYRRLAGDLEPSIRRRDSAGLPTGTTVHGHLQGRRPHVGAPPHAGPQSGASRRGAGPAGPRAAYGPGSTTAWAIWRTATRIYHYPDVAFAGDTAYLLYNAGHYTPTADGVVQRQERRLRVVPTSWLYGA